MAGREYETRETNQMKNESSLGSKEFFVGAFIGGLVGAAAALLFAPKAGKDLRETLNQQANMVKEKTGNVRENVVKKSSNIVSMTKEKSAFLTQAVTDQTAGLVNKAKSLTGTSEKDTENQESSTYIPINGSTVDVSQAKSFDDLTLADDTDVKQKLEEAKKAFDDEESKIKH